MGHWQHGCTMQFVSSSKRDDYFARTIKHVTNQLIKYDISDQKGSSLDGRDQRIPLTVSRAVIDFMVAGLGYVMRRTNQGSHFEIVRLHLDKGADPDGGSYPRTEEDYRTVERRCGQDVLEQCFPDILDCPGTALEAAAQKAHKEVVQLLLQPEFNTSRSSSSYRKAIAFAAMGGDADILKMLIGSADSSTLSESSLQTYWNRTLRYAAFCGKTETIPLLLDKGAHINRQYEDEINLGFSTPLGLAAFNGHNETILFLLQKGADINGGSLHPIYMATCRGFARTVTLLLDQGAEVHPVYFRFMERAAEYGEADVVRVFLERGLHQVPGRFDKGECALEIAKSTGHPRVVRVLEEFGVTE
ncbi:ankyrin repeat domain-containing protein [Aspergillus glaucus CBS 516.65]|uniref:Uncharacterized protein n=1 Tax=Aspergillus glaucus CBS 516.65 TaxID=1160497 RepID=A0A1L9VE38_ASPGL|nr:hypothetical protein ASPGLDRAFT_27595 [Aspergillus glaucus CBS 516.65]OJJ82208.1 hypothetical protein ASPGLDRAFT_27595 [Aspergillus glaucus CBS 516.65]